MRRTNNLDTLAETPADYGLPHDAWRPRQYETVQWAQGLPSVGVLEASVGSGKSVYAASLSRDATTWVLTRTKFLQEQYGGLYKATVLKGRGNYPCVHPDAVPGSMCDDCIMKEDGMTHCLFPCEYLAQKARALASKFVALNYPYWLASAGMRKRLSQAEGYLVLDEAQNLSEVTLNWAGCTIDDGDRIVWRLPQFPVLSSRSNEPTLFIAHDDPIAQSVDWLQSCDSILSDHVTNLEGAKEPAQIKRRRACEKLQHKVEDTLTAMRLSTQDWYIRSGPTACTYRGRHVPGFVCRPLTAKYHFPSLFLGDYRTLAMSATIGSPMDFAQELGIREYDFRAVPNRYSPEARRVYLLDCPPMSNKNDNPEEREARFEKQADEIAKAIAWCPPDWCGLIHVTRKMEAGILANRLRMRGLSDRVWPMPGTGDETLATDQQVLAWHERKRQVPNSICLTWAFMEGYDGLDERINISAKVPFPRMGDPGSYENAWMTYSKSRYNAQTALVLEQQMGRTRRGRDQDYDIDGQFNGLCAIADGSWERVKSKFSADFKEALVEV